MQATVDPNAKNPPGILLTSQSGTRLEITGNEIAIWVDNEKIVEIDTDGVAILAEDAFAQKRSYQFVDSSAVLMSSVKARKNTVGAQNVVTMRAEEVANYDVYATVEAESESDEIAQVELKAYHSAGSYATILAFVNAADAAEIWLILDGVITYLDSSYFHSPVNIRTELTLMMKENITPPTQVAGYTRLYVDTSGDLKVKFGDGTTKTLATNP